MSHVNFVITFADSKYSVSNILLSKTIMSKFYKAQSKFKYQNNELVMIQ